MDAVVVTILVIGILAIILLCATVLKHRKSLFRIATNNRFHVLSTVTLVLLIPEQLARATEFIALIAYNPEGVGKSANSRPLQWDQGTPEWVRSFALVVGDILQTVVAHCYVLVLLDRYYVFRPYLPFGNSVVFRRSLYGFFILMFIFSFSHFILMNSRKTSFSMSEQLSIMLARSLPFVAIAAFDLFVSIFVCRAAFSTTSLEYWENRLAAPNRSTTGETEEEQAWSLQKRPNLRKFNASSSIIGVHAPSPIPDTVAEGRSMNSVQLKEVVGSHPSQGGSLQLSPISPPPTFPTIAPPSPSSPPLSRQHSRRSSHAPFNRFPTKRGKLARFTSIVKSQPHRYTLILLTAALLTDLIGVFLYVSGAIFPALLSYSYALEYAVSCAVTIHISIAVFLMQSFKDVVNVSIVGH